VTGGSEWDDHAADWDDDPAARAYAGAAYASLLEAAAAHDVALADLSICDFGCGTGLLTERLVPHGVRIDAVDTSPAMLAGLDAKVAARGWSGVATHASLPSGGEGYHLIVCSSVLAFVDDHPAVVRDLVGRLLPGGLFAHWDWELDPDEAEPFGLTEPAIRDALRQAGLVDVRVGTGFELPFDDQVMQPLMGVGVKPRSS